MKWFWYALIVMTASLPGWAGADFVDSRKVTPGGTVFIKNVAGSVDVRGWARPEVHVEAKYSSGVSHIDMTASSPSMTKIVVVPARFSWRNANCKLIVHVPRECSLEVEAVSANVNVQEVAGALDLEAVSGDIDAVGNAESFKVQTVSGNIELRGDARDVRTKSVSGDIDIIGAMGRLEARTASGNIEVEGMIDEASLRSISGDVTVVGEIGDAKAENVSGDIDVRTASGRAEMSAISGRIELTGQGMTRIDLETISGSIEYRGSLAPAGNVQLSTRSGGVAVILPEPLNARVDISTSSGGIRNDFGIPVIREKHGSSERVGHTIGSGTASIRIDTRSGGVRIRKQ
ncbi:MAG: DUF4097 family beta strand repeat protein [Nitrospiraceae bacterium]|nr:DUF4097 family beta strand repeat protein [Nitrospiraceae bacterium]